MIVGSLLCFKNPITQVAYAPPPSAFTLIIDKNGYIGSKQPAAGNTYYAYLDKQADFSESGLGQVQIIDVEVKIGKRTYRTTAIGQKIWLAENLDYEFNGLQLNPEEMLYNTLAAYYGSNSNRENYGLLYNYFAVKYLNDNRATLLPDGWRVPSKSDYENLFSSVGGMGVAGNKLKTTSGWIRGNGTDSYGFSAKPAGYYFNGQKLIGEFAFFWTTTKYNEEKSYKMFVYTNSDGYINEDDVRTGYTLRLVKDVT